MNYTKNYKKTAFKRLVVLFIVGVLSFCACIAGLGVLRPTTARAAITTWLNDTTVSLDANMITYNPSYLKGNVSFWYAETTVDKVLTYDQLANGPRFEFLKYRTAEDRPTLETVDLTLLTQKGVEYGLTYSLVVHFALFGRTEDVFAKTNVINFTLPSNSTNPLPTDPEKEGHTFVGWYLDEALTLPYDGRPIVEDLALYAKFELNRYTVSFDSMGGSEIPTQTVDWNTSATLTPPTRTGHDFVGWFLPDGTEYTDGQPIKADTMLLAKWQLKTFTVTFYIGTEVYKTVTVNYGTILVDAMEKAKIADYAVTDESGNRLSKRASKISEDTIVLVKELTGQEKFGDYLGQHLWPVWLVVGLLGASAITITVLALLLKRT